MAITCSFMHCYAPNLEEVEVANWFEPVRLSIHLPPQKKSLILAPPPSPPPPPPLKIFFFFFRF